MKFSCERCQTRYTIGDDKVQGKILKIRCKTCANVIILREGEARSAETAEVPLDVSRSIPAAPRTEVNIPRAVVGAGGEISQSRPQPAPTPSVSAGSATVTLPWFVAIKGQQHGPVSFDDVVSMLRDGKISERSYLWNEQMPNWTRMRDLPIFASAVAAVTASRSGASAASLPATPKPPPAPADEGPRDGGRDAKQGAEIIPFNEAKAQLLGKDSRNAGANPQFGAFFTGDGSNAEAAGHAAGHAATANSTNGAASNNAHSSAFDPFALATDNSQSGIPEAAPDSTRVFIMRAGLHNRAKKHRFYAAAISIAALCFTIALIADLYGIIQIPGLHGVVTRVADSAGIERPGDLREFEGANADLCKQAELRGEYLSECHPKTNGGRKPNPRVGSNGVGGGTNSAINTTGTGSIDLNGVNGTGAGAGTDVNNSTGLTATGPANIPPADAARAAQVAQLLANGKTMQQLKFSPQTPTVSAGSAISVDDIRKVVANGKESVQQCIEDSTKRGDNTPGGKHILTLTVDSKGGVKQASFQKSNIPTELSTCIAKAARKWRFPAFSGDDVDIEIPYILGAN